MTVEEIIRRALRLLDVTLPPGGVTLSTSTARDVIGSALLDIGVVVKPATVANDTATARNVITYALRQCGLLEQGETPEADEAEMALVHLQHMLDDWLNEAVVFSLGTLTLNTVMALPAQYMEAVQSGLAVRLSQAGGREPDQVLAEMAKNQFEAVRRTERTTLALPVLADMLGAWEMEGISYGLGSLSFSTVMAVPAAHIEAIRTGFAARYSSRIGAQPPPGVASMADAGLKRVKQWCRALTVIDALNSMLGEWETRGVRLGAIVDDVLVGADTLPVPVTHVNAVVWNLAARAAPELAMDVPQHVAVRAEQMFQALMSDYAVVPVCSVDPALAFTGFIPT